MVFQKCEKRYEKHCILVIGVTAFWTSSITVVQLLSQIVFPINNFAGIYVHGRFPERDYSMIPIKASA
jgi:hypothetical protein